MTNYEAQTLVCNHIEQDHPYLMDMVKLCCDKMAETAAICLAVIECEGAARVATLLAMTRISASVDNALAQMGPGPLANLIANEHEKFLTPEALAWLDADD